MGRVLKQKGLSHRHIIEFFIKALFIDLGLDHHRLVRKVTGQFGGDLLHQLPPQALPTNFRHGQDAAKSSVIVRSKDAGVSH